MNKDRLNKIWDNVLGNVIVAAIISLVTYTGAIIYSFVNSKLVDLSLGETLLKPLQNYWFVIVVVPLVILGILLIWKKKTRVAGIIVLILSLFISLIGRGVFLHNPEPIVLPKRIYIQRISATKDEAEKIRNLLKESSIDVPPIEQIKPEKVTLKNNEIRYFFNTDSLSAVGTQELLSKHIETMIIFIKPTPKLTPIQGTIELWLK